jgi:hypothetical protein
MQLSWMQLLRFCPRPQPEWRGLARSSAEEARNRLHLLERQPGHRKDLHCLGVFLAGATVGESGIYISLAETEQELRNDAKPHGWEIGENVGVIELVPPESVLDPDHYQSLLYSSDLELGETVQGIRTLSKRVYDLAHVPEKHALAKAGVDTGFRHCRRGRVYPVPFERDTL